VPIFYASRLAAKSLRVYQTFINMMNKHVMDMMDRFINPFQLRHIKNLQNNDIDVLGSCVVMASPGFLQNGVSRQLFEAWCDNEANGVVIAGYTIEGTLAHDLLAYPTEIRCMDNRIKPRKCQIECISFSAHVDYNQSK
jgi:cleavage and polyadenylation specificity factor subunit 3